METTQLTAAILQALTECASPDTFMDLLHKVKGLRPNDPIAHNTVLTAVERVCYHDNEFVAIAAKGTLSTLSQINAHSQGVDPSAHQPIMSSAFECRLPDEKSHIPSGLYNYQTRFGYNPDTPPTRTTTDLDGNNTQSPASGVEQPESTAISGERRIQMHISSYQSQVLKTQRATVKKLQNSIYALLKTMEQQTPRHHYILDHAENIYADVTGHGITLHGFQSRLEAVQVKRRKHTRLLDGLGYKIEAIRSDLHEQATNTKDAQTELRSELILAEEGAQKILQDRLAEEQAQLELQTLRTAPSLAEEKAQTELHDLRSKLVLAEEDARKKLKEYEVELRKQQVKVHNREATIQKLKQAREEQQSNAAAEAYKELQEENTRLRDELYDLETKLKEAQDGLQQAQAQLAPKEAKKPQKKATSTELVIVKPTQPDISNDARHIDRLVESWTERLSKVELLFDNIVSDRADIRRQIDAELVELEDWKRNLALLRSTDQGRNQPQPQPTPAANPDPEPTPVPPLLKPPNNPAPSENFPALRGNAPKPRGPRPAVVEASQRSTSYATAARLPGGKRPNTFTFVRY
jgi:hypothetical protein